MPYVRSLELRCFASELQYHFPFFNISSNDEIMMLEQNCDLLCYLHMENPVELRNTSEKFHAVLQYIGNRNFGKRGTNCI